MGEKTTVVVTGSAGLIGAEASRFFSSQGYSVVGIDNDMRAEFFGAEASTKWAVEELKSELTRYRHLSIDIRDGEAIDRVFNERNTDIRAVVHTAAQPSHDWAAKDPLKDFSVNSNGTLNLLESFRKYSPEAAFVFTSTNTGIGQINCR